MRGKNKEKSSSEVSCVTLGAFFVFLNHIGHDPEPLVVGLSYSKEHLQNQHASIDFATFKEVCQRFRQMFPHDSEVCYRAGLKVFELQSFGFQHIIGALISNSPTFFYHICPRMIRQQFTMIHAVYTRTGKRNCKLEYHFDLGYEPFPEFIEVVRGLLAGMTIPTTGEPAQVVHRMTADGFALDISWPRSKSLLRRLYDMTIGKIQSYRRAVQELERGHTLLEGQLAESQDLSRRLEEHRRLLEQKVKERTAELAAQAESLQRSNEKLQQIDRAKRRFFTHLTHELKNPITLLSASAEALEQQLQRHAATMDPPVQENLMQMAFVGRQNVNRVAVAADDLMDLALLEESRLQPRLVPVDLVELCRALIQETKPWSEGLAVTVELDAPQSSPPSMAGDPRLLGKLLLNLLGNAIKFSPQGGTVTIRVRAEGEDLCLRVLDQGPGIPPEDRERIFQPFEKTADGEMSRAERGIGIGLSVAREVALLHRAELRVDDRPGGGSAFFLRIPLGGDEIPGVAQAHLAQPRPAGPGLEQMVQAQVSTAAPNGLLAHLPLQSAPEPGADDAPAVLFWPDQSKRKVLLIDDEVDILLTVGNMLEQDFEVSLASSAEDALRMIERDIPDAVVSDILMPGISGMQLCRILRQQPATRNMPILLITALGELQDKLRGFSLGADDYITKPFQYAELVARIKTQIRLRELTADIVASSNISVVGTMAAGIAHELKNPLNVLINSLTPLRDEVAEAEWDPERIKLLLDLATESGNRLLDVTQSFSNLVSHSAQPVLVDVGQLFQELLETRNARSQGRMEMALSCLVEEPLLLRRGQFSLVVGNLLDNAIDAILAGEGEGRLELACQANGDMLEVEVKDNGVGMDPCQLQQSLAMFSTTKEPGKGTGLGLSIVRQVLQAEEGRLALSSAPGEGTTARVWFPYAGGGRAADQEEPYFQHQDAEE